MTDLEMEHLADAGMMKTISEEIGKIFTRYQLDSIRIIATKPKGGETQRISIGLGNDYASYGAIKMWIMDHEESRAPEIRMT